jgi:hypothetical protein
VSLALQWLRRSASDTAWRGSYAIRQASELIKRRDPVKTLNRSAAIVRPKAPYIEWANGLDEGGPTMTLEEERRQPAVFLLPEVVYDSDFDRLLRDHFEDMFEFQLWLWMTDEDCWPSDRSFEVFNEWFDVEFQSMPIDLGARGMVTKEL